MEFMDYQQSIAFIAAFQDIFGIDTSAEQADPFLKGLTHYGESQVVILCFFLFICVTMSNAHYINLTLYTMYRCVLRARHSGHSSYAESE